jgi:hypothetical protein
MRRLLPYAVAGFSCLTIVDASTAHGQKIPEKWDRDGLVVGQIAGTHQFGLTIGSEKWTKVRVGRRNPDGGVFHGLILFKRGEGEHELASIYSDVGGSGTVVPIGRKFETTRGQITVLGLMACIPNPENKKQYRIITFDNTDETLDFIRRTYPEVLEGHEGATVVRAPGDYLPKERLVILRTGIARVTARKTGRQGQFWVAGIAGTIAEVNVKGDSVKVLRFIPPVTYREPVFNTYDEQGTLTFSAYGQKWRVVNGVVEELVDRVPGGASR